MHNGMLRLAGEEMHKSVGNDVSLKAALDSWGRETLLVFFLTGHWRKPLDYTDATLEAAAARAEGFREVFRGSSEPASEGAWERFSSALDDDFNTPAALAVMHEWRDHELLRRALGIFGLESLAEDEQAPAEIVELARQRDEARAAREFAEADRIRDEIESAGWEVRDEAGGFRLVRRR
jgi:cysteinyl-tRNA synthetase